MSIIEDALAKANEMRETVETDRNQKLPSSPISFPSFRLIITICLSLVLCAGLLYHVITNLPASYSKGKLEGKNVAPEKTSFDENRLPSSLSMASPDAIFSASHPGWQRYNTDSLEFRIFSEGKKVKAFQVIARNRNVIREDFFLSFMREIALGDRFKVHSTDEKGECLVERGYAGNKAEILRYKNKTDGTMSAFVVAYL